MLASLFVNTFDIAVEAGWPVGMKRGSMEWLYIGWAVLTAIIMTKFTFTSSFTSSFTSERSTRFTWRGRAISVVPFSLAIFLFVMLILLGLDIGNNGLIRNKSDVFFDSTLYLFECIIVFWLCLFYSLSAVGVPGIAIFICMCLVIGLCDASDNHYFRQSESETLVAPGIVSSFEKWLKERSDKDDFVDSYYPVYIVATEGGGIYAAYHAGIILGRIQDARKSFAEHVFAMSCVSGGSLGAAMFSAIVKHGGEERSVEDRIDRLLSQDLLTGVLLGATASDLAQRALPISFGGLDRARALEHAVEQAWASDFPTEKSSDNQFLTDISTLWRPDGTAPALMLNTTEVETGDRMVISPFSLKDATEKSGVLNLRALQDAVPGIDLPLSTAVMLSARFPFLTPAGSYQRDGQKHRLVDGGFFDNTGIETALDLIRMLDNDAQHAAHTLGLKGVRFILLSISAEGPEDKPAYSFGELMSPVRAMLATWRSRGPISVHNAERELNQAGSGEKRFLRIIMNSGQKSLPLTWYISGATRTRIRNVLAATTTCSPPEGSATLSSSQSTRANSSCTLAKIIAELPVVNAQAPGQRNSE